MASLTLSDTPLERRTVEGEPIWVKREDLCWPFPPLSKARGVYAAIESRPDAKTLAVVDTGRSLNGLLVATIGLTFGRRIVVGYPSYKANPNAIPGPTLAIRSIAPAGVELVPIPANRQFVMLATMKRLMAERHGQNGWFCFPTGLRLPETVDAAERQMKLVMAGLPGIRTVIVPTGTGTHLAGILRAYMGQVVAVQGYGRPEDRFRKDVAKMAGGIAFQDRLRVITSEHDYYEARPEHLTPWPANIHYEAKAYNWLRRNIKQLDRPADHPLVFWNIGQ